MTPSGSGRIDPLPAFRIWKCIVIGAIAGLASSILGIGGGVILAPLLGIWLKMPVKMAAGTSLVLVLVIASAGVVSESLFYPDHILWGYAAILSAGSLVGVRIGSAISARAPDRALAVAFGLVLMLVALKFLPIWGTGGHSQGLDLSLYRALGMEPDTIAWWALDGSVALLIGCLGGIAATLFGIGGGVIYVPALAIFFTAFASTEHPPRATSLAALAIGSVYGVWLHWRARNVHVAATKAILPAGIMAALGGAYVAGKTDSQAIFTAFAVLLIVLGLRLIISALKPRSPMP